MDILYFSIMSGTVLQQFSRKQQTLAAGYLGSAAPERREKIGILWNWRTGCDGRRNDEKRRELCRCSP